MRSKEAEAKAPTPLRDTGACWASVSATHRASGCSGGRSSGSHLFFSCDAPWGSLWPRPSTQTPARSLSESGGPVLAHTGFWRLLNDECAHPLGCRVACPGWPPGPCQHMLGHTVCRDRESWAGPVPSPLHLLRWEHIRGGSTARLQVAPCCRALCFMMRQGGAVTMQAGRSAQAAALPLPLWLVPSPAWPSFSLYRH